MRRVLVFGGRDYNDRDYVWRVLSYFHEEDPFSVLIHGGATGADTIAGEWARANGVREVKMLADWKKHGKAAGPIRNTRMLTHGKPDVAVGFPGGRGTADMGHKVLDAGVILLQFVE